MAFFGSSTPAPAPVLDLKTQLQSQITQELAVANASELVNKTTQNCFDKCIDQPQSTLTGYQNSCVDLCLDKYMRSLKVISKTYVSRIQQEKGN